MTTYAIDEQRHLLLASWATGLGDIAVAIAEVPTSADPIASLTLASALTGMSRQLWRCYTHPASAATSLEPNSEGWRRHGNREAFSKVIPALTNPNVPSGGLIVQSYIPVEEQAHRLGRALHELGNDELTALVADDVHAELDAVEKAERGELSGRARQAVVLTREDASPAQVVAADRLLNNDPFGSAALLTEVDPTAAAVAAAHWLQAAADVAAQVSGRDPTGVVAEADNIEAIRHETPTLVLEALAAGNSPRSVVTRLIRDAMAVAEGAIPNITALPGRLREVEEQASRFAADDPQMRAELIESIRATPLDPARPACDLLEDLLGGIRGCWLLYSEYADEPDEGLFGGDRDEGEEDEIDEYEQAEGNRDVLTDDFINAVREEAADQHERLL